MKKIKIGLIGCGQMGNYYAHNLKKREDAEISVCCDPSSEKLNAFRRKWGIPGGTVDWQELMAGEFEGVNGIINCSIDSLHSDIFSTSLESGIPLFTEKPFAVPLEILASVGRDKLNNHPFIINFSKRSLPAVAAACQFVLDGGLGKLTRLEMHYRQGWVYNNDFGDWRDTSAWFWRLTKRNSHYGVLGDLGSHLLDLAVLFGGKVESLTCRATYFSKAPAQMKGEILDSFDDAVCVLEYMSGALGLVSTSRTVSGEKDGVVIRVSGEKGSIRLNLEESRDSYEFFAAGSPVAAGWDRVRCQETPLRNLDAFIGLLKEEGGASAPGISEAVENQLLIEAAVRSVEEGRRIVMKDFQKEMLEDF